MLARSLGMSLSLQLGIALTTVQGVYTDLRSYYTTNLQTYPTLLDSVVHTLRHLDTLDCGQLEFFDLGMGRTRQATSFLLRWLKATLATSLAKIAHGYINPRPLIYLSYSDMNISGDEILANEEASTNPVCNLPAKVKPLSL